MSADTSVPLSVIYTTFASIKDAEHVGGSLIGDGLAACVNIIPGLTSIYMWQGKKHQDSEVMMLIKTRSDLAEKVLEETRKRHPYETPVLLVLDVSLADADYCAWVATQTAKHSEPKKGISLQRR